MAYFVTGGTGFIGRFLVQNLLKRGEPVYLLVRKSALKKLPALRETWGVDDKRVIAIIGDLAKPESGRRGRRLKRLKGKVEHLFHLAAIYDLAASAEDQQRANIDGTRHAVEFAHERAGRLLPSRELDRGRRPLRRRLSRGHVRGSRGARSSVFPHQAPGRRHRAQRMQAARGASTGPASSSATRRPATSTRSTGRITSSS